MRLRCRRNSIQHLALSLSNSTGAVACELQMATRYLRWSGHVAVPCPALRTMSVCILGFGLGRHGNASTQLHALSDDRPASDSACTVLAMEAGGLLTRRGRAMQATLESPQYGCAAKTGRGAVGAAFQRNGHRTAGNLQAEKIQHLTQRVGAENRPQHLTLGASAPSVCTSGAGIGRVTHPKHSRLPGAAARPLSKAARVWPSVHIIQGLAAVEAL